MLHAKWTEVRVVRMKWRRGERKETQGKLEKRQVKRREQSVRGSVLMC
jgi:hypothetical protein